ncbi:hypothetical protein MCEL_25470 [Mycolicibacterium celeriflavum]|uniref:Uncharacterized protein n=1 Tax=Mycolicibacterium celeriflavum TaxID=1249101 RepID=A0A7I7RI93_MYCCF|nr:hypothetical protein MCEL_25470 [Mycolicibacterium celeriflavum]
MGQAAGRVEAIDQYLEGHILVFIGLDAAPAYLGQKLVHRGIAGQIDAQHQRVDEESHQIVEGWIGATGDRKAHRDIGITAQP